MAEGGAFALGGRGLIVATDSTLRDPKRNPGRTRGDLGSTLLRASQCSSICWLPGDRNEDITRGHADGILAFAGSGTVLFNWIDDQRSPEYAICKRNLRAFRHWIEQEKRRYEIIKLVTLAGDAHGRGDGYCASYVNFAHVNEAVIVPKHGGAFSKVDERACALLREVFKKPAIPVDVTLACCYGGGIHCATQQEPAITAGQRT